MSKWAKRNTQGEAARKVKRAANKRIRGLGDAYLSVVSKKSTDPQKKYTSLFEW